MIRGVVEWSLQFRQLIVVAVAVLVFLGASEAGEMPVDVYPEYGPVVVEVRAESLGLSAQEVSELVTAPLEADLLTNVPWVDIIRSESVAGLSSVELIFEPGTDLLRARQVVQERVSEAAVALPGASRPPEILQPRSSTSRVMMIGISSDTLSLIDLSVLARWNMRPRLLGVEGVSNVAIWGMREKQLQVQVDPERLQALRVPLLQVIEATANALWSSPLSFVEAAVPGTSGWIDTPNQRIGVQHVSPITTPADLAQITLEERPGVRLSDVATVVEDHQLLIGDAVLKDGPGLILVIEKWPGASTTEVTKGIEEALAAMAPGLRGVDVDPNLYRPATYAEDAIDNVTLVALIAGVLVLLVLIAFLYDWRTAAISAVTIPLTLFTAAGVLNFLGESMNLVVLGGLVTALLLVIDDAVLSADSLWRRFRQGHEDGAPTSSVIRDALTAVQEPLVFATLIVLVVLVPFFFLNGLAGAFFPPMVLAYGLAIIASAVVAAVVTPALALLLFPKQPRVGRPSPLAAWLHRQYSATLGRVLANPMPALGVTALAVVVALGLVTQLSEPGLLPAPREQSVLIEWEAPPGTSRQEMTRVLTQVTEKIKALPGIADVGGHVGRAITADQVVGINSGEIWVTIAPDADYDATVNAIEGVMEGYSGFERALLTYPEQQVRHVLSGASRDVVVRVYGEDQAGLRTQAEAVKGALTGIKGIVDPVVDLPDQEQTIEVKVDLARAQRFGLKPGDVRRTASTMFSGLLVGNLFEEQKVFEVVVWSIPSIRSSAESVGNLLIDTPTGNFVRLSEVADVRMVPNPVSIKREAVSLYVDVTADVSGRSVGDVEEEITTKLQELRFPIEYHAEIATTRSSGYRESHTSVLPYVLVAIVGAFLLFQAAFNSWRLAAVAVIVLPAALAGGIIAAVIDGGDMSIGSYLGLVAVGGLSVRSGVLLVTRYQALERSGGGFDAEAAMAGASERMLPVVVTSLAGILSMLTIVLAGSIPGFEVIQPMAVVALGGLITYAMLSLFVLPALYLRLWQPSEPEVVLS